MPSSLTPGNRRGPRTLLTVAVVLAVAGSAGCTSLPVCAVPSVAEAIPNDGALLGVNPDWANQTLDHYAAEIGHRPAVAVSFADVPMTAADAENVRAAGDQVARNGGVLLLTLEPKEGLAAVTAAVGSEVADVVSSIEDTGTPVVVRFAHEMNGSWYAWGQQPVAYIAAFRTMSGALRDGTESAAMMWAPNYGGGYPFAGGAFEATQGSIEFTPLDTNSDGVLTTADDPYGAYYPGDDVVDWVGMSLYHWGSKHPWGENEMPETGKFAQQLTGDYVGLGGDDTSAPNFYALYGVDKGKPVAIPETAALVVPSGDERADLAIKQAWWQQVLSDDTADAFPNLRMINWFDWHKFEPEVGEDVDWSVSFDETTSDAFAEDLPSWARFASKPTRCASPAASPE